MEYRCLALCLWVFFVLFQYNGCLGCLQQERIGLLEIKASILKEPLGDPLLTWVDDSKSDCCNWERVVCNNATRRVVQLSLDDAYGYLGFLNASMFLPFGELQHLDLSDNWIAEISGIESLSKLKWLETINLRWNEFNSSFLPSLGALASLKSLDLSENYLGDGSSYEIYRGIKSLSKLKWLETLNLRRNDFNISLLPSLGALTSLKSLDLSYNRLGDGSSYEISRGIEGLSKLKWLETINLGFNYFNISFLPSLGALASLKSLDLSYNRLGDGSSSEISRGIESLSKLKLLETLNLEGNNFNSSLLPSLGTLTSLKSLNLAENNLGRGSSSEISRGLQSLSELKKLEALSLNSNEFKSSILPYLGALTSLKTLDLGQNELNGSLSRSYKVFTNLSNLEVLYLGWASLDDSHIFDLANMTKLKVLDLSGNNFYGQKIPQSILSMKYLQALSLSGNELNDSISEYLDGADFWQGI